ncbi:MAG: lysine--tRNA ligase, partial [Gaiellaceae bacterium]|nr:lysine--tRNA ligase [Gaiellaceae bacterium]
MVSAIRAYLDAEGFVEVETPILQPRYGGAFAQPFVTRSELLDGDLYLRIATELYLKRLIVGGLERVYEIGKDFRNEGSSYKHHPEFTMLEWYEAYADYRDTMERIEELVERVALETVGTTTVLFRGHEVDLARPWRRVRFTDALGELGLWMREERALRAALEERGVDTGADGDWPQLVDHAFSHFVEPTLIEPTIVYDYPVELSPFARATDDDPTLAERFEYFAG